MSEFINPPLLIGIAIAFIFYFTSWTTIIVLFAIFAGILGLVYFNQNKLLYMPVVMNLPKSPSENSRKMRHPREHSLQTIDLKLKTEDGLNVCGWHVQHPESQRIIIYFHENAGNIGTRIYFIKQLSRFTGSDVILVAYRGYSDSQGQPSQEGLKRDSYAILTYALDYAKDHSKKVYAMGSSLGGAVAINVASKPQFSDKIDGVILQNTFTSISEMIDAIMPIFTYVKFLQTNHWRSIDLIGYIKAPILFIKSQKDELIPPSHMHALMNNANQSKLIHEYQIEEGTHNSHWEIDPQTYFSKLIEFFSASENKIENQEM